MNIFFPILAAIFSNLIWGSTFMASKIVLRNADPLVVTIMRFLIATVSLAFLGILRKEDFQLRIVKERFWEILMLGLVGYSGLYYFQMIALKSISSSQSAAIMLLAPIFTLIGNVFLSKKILFKEFFVIGICFIGAYLVLIDSHDIVYSDKETKGVILTLIASVCLGISVLQTKRLLQVNHREKQKPVSVYTLTFFTILIGSIGLIIIAFIERRFVVQEIELDKQVWGWLFYLGIVCSVLAFILWNWSIKHAPPAIVAGAMYLKTPVALALGAYILSENLSLVFYLGTTAILASLLLNQFFTPGKNER